MYEVEEKVFKFKFKGEIHTLREITVGELEELERKIKEEDVTEIAMQLEIARLAGLSGDIARTMSLSQLQALAKKMNEAK